jgi:hypothetical protein
MEHMASRPAVESHCGKCGQTILIGLDSGITARVDPHPISWGGEIAALLAGRWTYEKTHAGDLTYRDEHRLGNRKPFRRTIHAEHLC